MFGIGDGTWNHFYRSHGSVKRKSYSELVEYGNLFLAHLLEPKDLSSNPNTYADGVPKDPFIKRKEIIARIAKISLIEGKINSTTGLQVRLVHEVVIPNLRSSSNNRTLIYVMAVGRSFSIGGGETSRLGSESTTIGCSRL